MNKFFVATPTYYINDKPHIGHAYSTFVADVIARYYRQQGKAVLFSTGVDENAQKTVNAAEAAGEDTAVYTKEMSKLWESTWKRAGIDYDVFTRTTSAKHKKAVYELIKRVEASGDLYKDTYEGFYCVGCEAFIKEKELVDGLCPTHQKKPEWIKEENYFFRLSKYQKPLLDYIDQHPGFIQPKARHNEVVSFIKQGLQDFSVSRSTQKWGITWPGDNKQVVYVWFDALANYLTAADFPDESYKKLWPVDLHIVGKDIIRFHCVYWPAILLSAGIELPKTVFAHGFFTIDGQKISKSLGNAVDPVDLAGDFGVDALRNYLIAEIPFGEDGEFSHKRFEAVYNSNLANSLGNLVQRVAVLATKHLDGKIGRLPKTSVNSDNYDKAFSEIKLTLALEEVWKYVHKLNLFLQEKQPWEVVKTDRNKFEAIIGQSVADLLEIASLLEPFLPETSEKIKKTFANSKVHVEVGLLFPK